MITPLEENLVYYANTPPQFSKKLKKEKPHLNPFFYSTFRDTDNRDNLFRGVLKNIECDLDFAICSFCISPDEKKIAIGTSEGDIFIYNLEQNHLSNYVISAHISRISSVVFLKDKILSCGHDKLVKVFNLEGQLLFFMQHEDWVNECRVARNGKVVVSCSNDNTAKLWNLEDEGKCLLILPHKSMVYACGIYTPLDPTEYHEKTRIITGDRVGFLNLFNLKGESLNQVYFEDDYIFYQSCSFSTDGQLIVVGSFQGYIRILETDTLSIKKQVKVCKHYAEEPTFSIDSKLILCYADTLSQTQLLSSSTLSCLQIINEGRTPRFSPNSSTILCTQNNNLEIGFYWSLEPFRKEKLILLLLARKFDIENYFYHTRFPLDMLKLIVMLSNLLIFST